MPTVGSERECGIPQTTQIPHRLTIGRTSQPRILRYSFFQLGVRDLAFCLCSGQTKCRYNCRPDDSFYFDHADFFPFRTAKAAIRDVIPGKGWKKPVRHGARIMVSRSVNSTEHQGYTQSP